jgi:hypothetical protein
MARPAVIDDVADQARPDAGQAVARAIGLFGLSEPVTMLMLVEDPGAANFAAGLLPMLRRHGPVAVHAAGEGAAQLRRLGVPVLPLAARFDAAGLLADARPDLVIVGTSEDRGAATHGLVAACREMRIASVGFIDGPANIECRFRGDGDSALAYAPDAILVPTADGRRQFVELGMDPERVITTPHPHFAHVEAEGRRLAALGRPALRRRMFPDCPNERPILVFLAERSGGLDADAYRRSRAYTLAGRGGDERRTNIVLEEVLDAAVQLEPPPFMVLRLHPKNDPAEFDAYRSEIDQVSRDEPALELVYAADAVVGLTTMLLSEATALGRPVLSVVPRAAEQAWLLDPPRGRLPCVWERSRLVSALREMVAA